MGIPTRRPAWFKGLLQGLWPPASTVAHRQASRVQQGSPWVRIKMMTVLMGTMIMAMMTMMMMTMTMTMMMMMMMMMVVMMVLMALIKTDDDGDDDDDDDDNLTMMID